MMKREDMYHHNLKQKKPPPSQAAPGAVAACPLPQMLPQHWAHCGGLRMAQRLVPQRWQPAGGEAGKTSCAPYLLTKGACQASLAWVLRHRPKHSKMPSWWLEAESCMYGLILSGKAARLCSENNTLKQVYRKIYNSKASNTRVNFGLLSCFLRTYVCGC